MMKRGMIMMAVAMIGLTVSAQFSITSETNDLDVVCEKARAEKKLLIVSYGRLACSNCRTFYEYVTSGALKIDSSQFIYLALDADNYDHHEAFNAIFSPDGYKLPYVGVMTPERKPLGMCHVGIAPVESFQAMLTRALDEAKEIARESALPAAAAKDDACTKR